MAAITNIITRFKSIDVIGISVLCTAVLFITPSYILHSFNICTTVIEYVLTAKCAHTDAHMDPVASTVYASTIPTTKAYAN